MKVLFLAPEPFFQSRGTPIAIDRLLRVLSEQGHEVDLLTYHEGSDVRYAGLRLHRIPNLPFIRNIQPGFSLKKLVCDFLLLLKALNMARQAGRRYQIVHAVEEAVFIALLLKLLFRLPYVYDMDSALSQQLVERHRALRFLLPLLTRLEGLAARQAKAVVPVCEAILDGIPLPHATRVVVLHDTTLLEDAAGGGGDDLRAALGIDGSLLLYVGNLKRYQGIDLLLESFALVRRETTLAALVVVGGESADIEWYAGECRRLGVADAVHFVGPRPVEQLSAYLAQADILVSPRIQGNNTPMKIYSYLDSGKPVVATDLPTHTQVLDSSVALLAAPRPQPFAAALLRLLADETLRRDLGAAGRSLVQEKYTQRAFRGKLTGLYDWLQAEVAPVARRDGAA
ncbi:MAG: glycosyltransferase family 4 protein [Chloroflexota bacterium]